jgi:choline dehydrogenase-like flavoprotein
VTGSYDVIVIGSGAGGGTVAHRLAPSGQRILLLERGDWLAREPQNWLSQDVFVDGRYMSEDTWYDEGDKPFQPQVHYFVGGASKLYGAALYCLRERDFGELRHHDGISPAWPIGYEEMEPYYTQAEQLYPVHGTAERTRRNRPRAPPIPSLRSRTSRASSSSQKTSPPRAVIHSTPPAGSCSTRQTCPTARACAAPTAMAFPVWCMRRQTRM